jgi:integrase
MRLRRHGHVRQRSPGTWEVRYTLGTEPGTGNRRTFTTTVKGDRKDAEKELRRLLRMFDTGEHVDPTRMTVRQWLEFWLSAVREEVSPKSHERYGEIVRNFLVPELGAVAITKLAPMHIQAAYSKWAVEGRRDGKSGGLAPRTRRHIHRILKSALARAVEQQVLARNPADVFKKRLPKVEHRQMVTLTTEQATRFLDVIKHKRLYGPVLIALTTGMRRGEILALRWRNVDLERATLHVVESLEQTKGGLLRFKAPKTDKARAITLPSFAVEELRRLKREQAEELFSLGVRQSGETLVCARADGKPRQPRSLTHEFTYLVARCKDIPRVRFHDLRHSHAAQLLRAGIHPKVAQERLGHSTISTTLDLYTHVSKTMQQDASAEIDAAFRSAMMRGQSQD